MLFESICNSQWFVHTSVILFLNKIDLFKEKLPTSPVRKYFPDYVGDPKSYKHASQYFEESFKRLNRNATKVCALTACPATTYTVTKTGGPCIGHLCSLYECYGYKPAEDHHVECPGYDSPKKPTNPGTIDIPMVAAQ